MDIWGSFLSFVYAVGIVGSALLLAGFAADGELARALFYVAVTAAFTVGLRAHRGQQALQPAPARAVESVRVIDLTAAERQLAHR